jgi:hypothetical protein
MIDLDRYNFISERALNLALKATLKSITDKLGVDTPTVIWSGRGYHVIQPLDANGIMLEHVKEFDKVPQPSVKFLRFAEWFLSNGGFLSDGKSDHSHNNTVSFGNMMLRIPGSVNSKNGQVVRVIHKWNGHRPEMNYLLRDFRHWLIDWGLKREQQGRQKVVRRDKFDNSNNINWIDKLLQTPISDYRKLTIWHILAPYLMTKRRLSYNEAYIIILEWLDKCDKLRELDFKQNRRIKLALNRANRFFPISLKNLKFEHEKFYHLLKERGVLTQ